MPSDPAGVDPDLPDINDRLVEPDTPYEIYDGELVRVSPADPPHAERHLQLCALIEAHTGPGFEAGCDLLTRTSKLDDVAPDVSVYPEDPDPRSGRRQLEQLAFEVVSKQRFAKATRKAKKLTRRGVRRVFAIDVGQSRMLEWSTARRTWCELDAAGHIIDAALEVALPIEALLHSAKADDAVARALVAKHNPVIEAVREEGRAEGTAQGRAEGVAQGRAEGAAQGRAEGIAQGRAEGMAQALVGLLAARGVALDQAERDRILSERDLARLERWIARAATCASSIELLAEP